MSDGIAWIGAELGRDGFALTMVRGMGREELAARLGAGEDGGLVGESGNGWAFAIEPPEAPFRDGRIAAGRELCAERTVVSVLDTTMDPPVVTVHADGGYDWMFCEFTTRDTDHPLTRRLLDGGGFVENGDRVHRDDDATASHADTMAAVYRALGAHYGLTLPRREIVGGW